MFTKTVPPAPTAIERRRAVRKLEAKEHKYLAPRSVEEWNHSECRPCERKRRGR